MQFIRVNINGKYNAKWGRFLLWYWKKAVNSTKVECGKDIQELALTTDNAHCKYAWESRAESWDWVSLHNGKNKSALNKEILMYIFEPMLGLVQLYQLSGWKRFLSAAGCLRNKNIL